MKVTNSELLEEVWKAQLKYLATAVIQTYVGARIGVCDDKIQIYHYMIYYRDITDKLSHTWLLTRLRRLEHTNTKVKVAPWGNKVAFGLDKSLASEPFETAREFWLFHDIPTGWDKHNGCCRTTPTPRNMYDIATECREVLYKTYLPLEF